AEALLIEDLAEFTGCRLRHFVGNQLECRARGVASAAGANQKINGFGELDFERGQALGALTLRPRIGKQGRGTSRCQHAVPREPNQAKHAADQAEPGAEQDELAGAHSHAGLAEPVAQRGAAAIWSSQRLRAGISLMRSSRIKARLWRGWRFSAR